MKNIQQPFFQRIKPITYANQMNPIIQANINLNPPKNINTINLQSTPQIIPNNKALKRIQSQSPLPTSKIDENHFSNGINLQKILHLKSYTSYDTPKLLGNQNYRTNSFSNNKIKSHNFLPGTISNQNIIGDIPINQSTIKPVNGAIINNPNQTNNIVTNQNVINLIDGNSKNISFINNIQTNQNLTANNPITNPNIINNSIQKISNHPIQNIINTQIPNSSLNNNSIPKVNTINSQVQNPIIIKNQVSNPNIININNTSQNFPNIINNSPQKTTSIIKSISPNFNAINNSVHNPSNTQNNIVQNPPNIFHNTALSPPTIINNSGQNPPTVSNNSVQNPPTIINNSIQNPPTVFNNSVQNPPTVINNSVQNPPNIMSNLAANSNVINNLSNTINSQNYGIIPNKNLINPINGATSNLNSTVSSINNFRNGINNKISFVPNVEISLLGPKSLGQQSVLMNNNALSNNILREPNESLNLAEFKVLKEIGQGTFGKIFKVLWMINNKIYALKKEILRDIEGVKARLHRNEAIKNFIKQTNCRGVVNVYSNLTIPNGHEFQYYELMEMCDMDFEQEIKNRSLYNKFYSQQEMFGIMLQLISTLSFLQKCHITHRDIKPQNILISNGIYKLCDFGDIRVMQREGIVVQRVRGSELYMSPILFNGLRTKLLQVRHNTYKSDVFSLGMCFLLAACLSYDGLVEIRELSNMNQKDFILNKYLSRRYSPNLVKILHFMLQTEESNRPDFILLESLVRQYGI